MRRILAIVLVLGLAACAQPPAPPPPPPPLDAAAACLRDLTAMGVTFQAIETFGEPDQGCGIANPVKVSRGAIAWNRPGVVSCDMARTLARFELQVIQPLAQSRFGQDVKKIHHAGTYDCRIRRTSSNPKAQSGLSGSKGGRLSEHAKGQAIDLSAIELTDGRMVSIKNDWRGDAVKSGFLRDLARASCQTFNVVLTPNHDRLHQDHFHLDIGPHTLCGY